MTHPTRISSTANPLIKRVRALQARKVREAQGVFLVEGVQAVWQAADNGAAIETVLVAPDLLPSARARGLVERLRREGVQTVELTRDVFETVAEHAHASGLAALVRIRGQALSDLTVSANSLYVALHGVQYPGNLGTILRTVDAVAGTGVILIGDATDPYHPQAVKASAGALFTVPHVQVPSFEPLLDWCAEQGVHLVTTSPRAPLAYWSAAYALPAVLLFGSEGQGLPEEVIAAGQAVHIPMAGQADSLNLAVSVGVMLYEVRRQQAG